MPISATGNNREAGFTLVELMVVIVLTGVMATAVMVTLPDPRRRASDDAATFAARLAAARDLAIVGGHDVSVHVDAAGYGFDQRRGKAWVPVAAKALQPARWSDGVTGTSDTAALLFDTTGIATPAQVALHGRETEVVVSVDTNGKVLIHAR